MKTLKEVSDLVGMSRRVIQEYEKAGLAQIPETRNKYGYLLYDQPHIDRLWKIRFYRELGYDKNQLRQVLENPDCDRQEEMACRIRQIQKKKQELENLMVMAAITEETGLTPDGLRKGIPSLQNTDYDRLLPIVSMGVRFIRENRQLMMKAVDSISDAYLQDLLETLGELLELSEEPPESVRVQERVCLLHQKMAEKISPSVLMLSGFNLLWAPGSKGERLLGQALWPGCGTFLYSAVSFYCKSHRRNPTDTALLTAIHRLELLGGEGVSFQAPEVQEQVAQLHRFFRNIPILTPAASLQILSGLGTVYASESCRELMEDTGDLCRFLSHSIAYYCEQMKETEEKP